METIAHFLSPIGWMLLSAEEDTLTRVRFLDAHPETRQEAESEVLRQAVGALHDYFSGNSRGFSVPIRPNGTPFQLEVWQKVAAIPYGKTLSYKALAQQLGSPNLTRAVGSANGSNPLGLLIPCHRVVGADGDLTGYAWGLDRKKWLLAHESGLSGAPRQLALF